MAKSVYDIVTETIINKLESVNPNDWKKPWFNIGLSPFNAISKKPYRGVNYMTLGMNSHESKAYASFKQWQGKDCQVRKGEKSHLAVFWKVSIYEDKETGEEKKGFMLRYYRVFNSEQVDGDFARGIEKGQLKDLESHPPYDEAESRINAYLTEEGITLKESDHALYSPARDRIEMPKLGQFKDQESFYSTFFHEIIHSTGHTSRLDRDLTGGFGSQKYAKEELIAELGAAMVLASLGLAQRPRLDHAQYIKSWLQALKDDSKFVVQAAGKAQKAADYALQINHETESLADAA